MALKQGVTYQVEYMKLDLESVVVFMTLFIEEIEETGSYYYEIPGGVSDRRMYVKETGGYTPLNETHELDLGEYSEGKGIELYQRIFIEVHWE